MPWTSRGMALLGITVSGILVAQASGNKNCSQAFSNCRQGLMLPIWEPTEGITILERAGRASIYLVALVYMFLGVSIAADRFMSAIEVITSKERTVTVRRGGNKMKITVRVWNETVSNLTLMALGSSAPEILLSLIEICGNGFNAGELGPNTIVGSAAFNLMIIIAVCVLAVPSNQVRRQLHLNVFFVTAIWSIFAYIWLYLILAVISPSVIEVWEGVVTFLFFPLTVLTAYIADRKILILPIRYRADSVGLRGFTSNVNNNVTDDEAGLDLLQKGRGQECSAQEAEFERQRRQYMNILSRLRQEMPDSNLADLQEKAMLELAKHAKKSRAFYRVQATRQMIGDGNIVERRAQRLMKKHPTSVGKRLSSRKWTQCCTVSFDPCHYTVLENVGIVRVRVVRHGGLPNLTIMVDYKTGNGTATAGTDYVPVKGTLVMDPTCEEIFIEVIIIDDDIFEEDEHFYIFLGASVLLSAWNVDNLHISDNLRIRFHDGSELDSELVRRRGLGKLVTPSIATVMILDDDHPGVFSMEQDSYEVSESDGEALLKVVRRTGCRGRIMVPYSTADGTGRAGVDYEHKEGTLLFENEEIEKFIKIGIINKQQYERNEFFTVYLLNPKKQQENDKAASAPREFKMAEIGKPTLGDKPKCVVIIKESREFKKAVDMLIDKTKMSQIFRTSSWTEQFIEAVFLRPEGEEAKASACQYVIHILTMPWKVACAFMPPTDYLDGWASFVFSILLIAIITAAIGDLANHFGCTIGLIDAVTAITFVAIGTSIPDTFASHVSAIQDSYADSCITNVTGSNAVNVFLGIGLAWTVAAIYHSAKGQQFLVPAGTLAYSVTIFCVEALLCVVIIVLRRCKTIGGELGGPMPYKLATAITFISLWMLYILLSSLESYCIIAGF